MQRLRNVFRSAVAGDVARLKEAVGEYKENTSRLECQKQLLLKQVRHNRHGPACIFAPNMSDVAGPACIPPLPPPPPPPPQCVP